MHLDTGSDVDGRAPGRPDHAAVTTLGLILAGLLLVLHAVWALGGTWGRSLCGYRGVTVAEAADGCAGHPATAAEWATGWVGVVCWAAVTVLLVAHRHGRPYVGATVAAAAALVTVAFPLHLPFEVAGGLMGEPTDWRTLTWRLGALLVAVALALGLPRHPRRPPGPVVVRSLPTWAVRSARVAVWSPVAGWVVPHAFWMLGVPLGLEPDLLAEARSLPPTVQLAITAAPLAGAALTHGLTRGWSQRLPDRVPRVGGRRVPTPAVVAPAGLVSWCLTTYGLLGVGLMLRALQSGRTSLAELATGWSVVLVELTFVVWGVGLGLATLGYALVVRPRPSRS